MNGVVRHTSLGIFLVILVLLNTEWSINRIIAVDQCRDTDVMSTM